MIFKTPWIFQTDKFLHIRMCSLLEWKILYFPFMQLLFYKFDFIIQY